MTLFVGDHVCFKDKNYFPLRPYEIVRFVDGDSIEIKEPSITVKKSDIRKFDYLEEHKKCGLKVGDIVRVKEVFGRVTGGWIGDWDINHQSLNGLLVLIVEDNKNKGFKIKYFEMNSDWDVCINYPFFELVRCSPEVSKYFFRRQYKPFQKMLYLSTNKYWYPGIFKFFDHGTYYFIGDNNNCGNGYKYALPFEGNEKLAFNYEPSIALD